MIFKVVLVFQLLLSGYCFLKFFTDKVKHFNKNGLRSTRNALSFLFGALMIHSLSMFLNDFYHIFSDGVFFFTYFFIFERITLFLAVLNFVKLFK